MGAHFLLLCQALVRNMAWLPNYIWKKQKQQKKGGGKRWGGAWKSLTGKGGTGGRNKKSIAGNQVKPEKKVWIGGLPVIDDPEKRKEASRHLQTHFKMKGSDCKFAKIWPHGVGVACFQTEEAAQSAIAEVSGTKFKGKTLDVDSWQKKEKP